MGIQGLISAASRILSQLLVVSMGVALIVFFWGMVTYIFKASDVQSKNEGKNKMIWGVVALFVMVSVWGIIGFVQGELGIVNTTVPGQRNNPPPGGGGGGGGGGGDDGFTVPPPDCPPGTHMCF